MSIFSNMYLQSSGYLMAPQVVVITRIIMTDKRLQGVGGAVKHTTAHVSQRCRILFISPSWSILLFDFNVTQGDVHWIYKRVCYPGADQMMTCLSRVGVYHVPSNLGYPFHASVAQLCSIQQLQQKWVHLQLPHYEITCLRALGRPPRFNCFSKCAKQNCS